MTSAIDLGECSRGYFNNIYDPWTYVDAGIPTGYPRPSNVYRSFFIGDVQANNNRAWITVYPQCIVTNDQFSVFTSNTTTVNPYPSTADITTTVANRNAYMMTGNHATAAYDPYKREVRIVSYGIRVKYQGTLDNMGGNLWMYCAKSPGESVLNVTDTVVKAYTDVRSYVIDDDWFSVIWRPSSSEQCNYVGENAYLSSVGNISNVNMCIYIYSAAPTPKFQVEISCIYEVSGYLETDAKFRCCDVVGFCAVLEQVQRNYFYKGHSDDVQNLVVNSRTLPVDNSKPSDMVHDLLHVAKDISKGNYLGALNNGIDAAKDVYKFIKKRKFF